MGQGSAKQRGGRKEAMHSPKEKKGESIEVKEGRKNREQEEEEEDGEKGSAKEGSEDAG